MQSSRQEIAEYLRDSRLAKNRQKIAEYLRECPEVEDFQIESLDKDDPIIKITVFLNTENDMVRKVYE